MLPNLDENVGGGPLIALGFEPLITLKKLRAGKPFAQHNPSNQRLWDSKKRVRCTGFVQRSFFR
jgi:hypothetical protein